MTEPCVSFKRIVTTADTGVFWHEFYVPLSAMDELTPPSFIEGFLTTYNVDDETDDVRKVLDALTLDERVKIAHYSQFEASGYWKTGGKESIRHEAEGSNVVPFPPGLHVCMQHTAILTEMS